MVVLACASARLFPAPKQQLAHRRSSKPRWHSALNAPRAPHPAQRLRRAPVSWPPWQLSRRMAEQDRALSCSGPTARNVLCNPLPCISSVAGDPDPSFGGSSAPDACPCLCPSMLVPSTAAAAGAEAVQQARTAAWGIVMWWVKNPQLALQPAACVLGAIGAIPNATIVNCKAGEHLSMAPW